MPHPMIGRKCKHLGILTAQMVGNSLTDLEPTPVQSHILNYLVRHQQPPPCQRDVEEFFSLSHPTVSGILSRLEEKGFITFLPDPEDRRRKRILVTQKALVCAGKTADAISQVEAQLLSGFTPEEQLLFNTFLDRAIRNLNGDPCQWPKKEESSI